MQSHFFGVPLGFFHDHPADKIWDSLYSFFGLFGPRNWADHLSRSLPPKLVLFPHDLGRNDLTAFLARKTLYSPPPPWINSSAWPLPN